MSTLVGTSGNDNLAGGTAADTILGLQGNDTLVGGGGNDLIYGGQGTDSISFGVANTSSVVFGDEGADTIFGLGGRNTILGGTGNAAIDSADGADLINANADAAGDIIFGNGGDDTIFGPSVAAAGGFNTAQSTTQLIGGFGNDIITVGGSVSLIQGNQGNDTITFGASGLTATDTVYGGTGDDQIASLDNTPGGGNFIFGGEGNDTITFAGGNNTIAGGTGNAAIDSQFGAAGDGNDSIVASGGVGNDLILGNYGSDTINVSAQAGGTDILSGGQGNDLILVGQSANDVILGNQGSDSIFATTFTAGTDSIYGGVGDDSVTAGSSTASAKGLIYGDEGNNLIAIVGTQNNTVYGGVSSTDAVGNGDGNDIINLSGQVTGSGALPKDLVFGGSGSDSINVGAVATATVTGGAGADTIGVGALGDATNFSVYGGSSGLDQVSDFVSGVDKFNINSSVTGTPGHVTVSSVTVVGSLSGTSSLYTDAATALGSSATPGNAAVFQFGTGDYFLAVNTDSVSGYGAGDVLIDIGKTSSLSANDFI